MRKGFSYPAYLIYCALLATLLLTTMPFFLNSVQKTLLLNQNINQTKIIIHALDAISEDLQYAKTVSLETAQISFIQNNINYSYGVTNQRLAKKKEGTTYLTPKEIVITDFKAATLSPHLLKISFNANQTVYERYIKRIIL